jgi:hypothetical protein
MAHRILCKNAEALVCFFLNFEVNRKVFNPSLIRAAEARLSPQAVKTFRAGSWQLFPVHYVGHIDCCVWKSQQTGMSARAQDR